MRVRFAKLSPSENMTILVRDPIPREKHGEFGVELMRYGHIHAEQVGFIEEPQDKAADCRLQMLGGFCGNGMLSLAALFAHEKHTLPGNKIGVTMEADGADKLLHCEITVLDEGLFSGRMSMPLPVSIEEAAVTVGGGSRELRVVRFPGITHFIAVEPNPTRARM